MSSDIGSNYVIEMVFESDDGASALAKANSWLTLQARGVELQTVVGDAFSVSVYYTVAQEKPKAVNVGGSFTVVGPGGFTTTNGSVPG